MSLFLPKELVFYHSNWSRNTFNKGALQSELCAWYELGRQAHLGVDTLPSQRVPQKILKKSISLYYIPYYYPSGHWPGSYQHFVWQEGPSQAGCVLPHASHSPPLVRSPGWTAGRKFQLFSFHDKVEVWTMGCVLGWEDAVCYAGRCSSSNHGIVHIVRHCERCKTLNVQTI